MLAMTLAVAIVGLSLSGAGASIGPVAGPGAELGWQQPGGHVAAPDDPGDAQVGIPFTLDAGGSHDAVSYTWNFGDGSAPGSGASVQHTYSLVDDYHVRLTVQDRQGNSETTTRTVRVLPVLGTLTAQPDLGQVVPASSFTALLELDAAGPAQVSAKIGGRYLFSDRWDFQGGSGPALFQIPDVRVVNEDDPDIISELLSQPGASIPLTDNVTVTLTYAVSGGGTESPSYTMSLLKPLTATANLSYHQAPTATPAASAAASRRAAAARTAIPTSTPTAAVAPAPAQPVAWSITYPSYLPIVGRPVIADDVDDYYVKGDREFHHVDTLTVRQFALKIARNGGVFPNDPQRAADNIYRYVNGLLGIGDPGELQMELTLIARVENGVLVPGARRGEYICIAHAYFVSSLTRTLGLPTRELTIGFGRAASQDDTGAWKLNFYQEGANEVWYAGAWHHYDTWVGTRDRADYLDSNLTEVAWYAFSEQSTPFLDVNDRPVGLSGHDFSIGKYVGSPGAPEQWRFLEQQTRPGVRLADPGPEAYASADRAATAAPRITETVVAGIRNPETAPADGAGQ